MEHKSLRSIIMLFLTAVIWGVAFVAQSVGMEYVGPFTFNFSRSIIGSAVLVPCIYFLDHLKRREQLEKGVSEGENKAAGCEKTDAENKVSAHGAWLVGGIWCGIILFIASNLQQFGIQYTSVGKAGFITALYIVLVPVFRVFQKERVKMRVWLSVAMAVVGLYLLCMTGGFSVSKGDFLLLLCALAFTFHIIVIDHFTLKADGVRMSCVQFLVCGLLSGVGMLLTEKLDFGAILTAWQPILYAGVMSCGVAYTLQIVGQKGIDPTIASLILSLESVVSVLAGWLILGQILSTRELFGCALMFAAIILTQLPDKAAGKS